MRALLIAAIALSATTAVAQPTTATPTTTAAPTTSPTPTTTPTTPTTTTTTPPAEEERPLIWSTPAPWVTILVGGAAAFGSLAVLTWVPLPTDNLGDAGGAITLAAPFIITSGAVVGTRLLLPEPTPLNVTLPAVGASVGLATGFFVASIFNSTVIPEHTAEGSGFRKNASLAAFAVGVAGGAAVGTAIGVLVADVIE